MLQNVQLNVQKKQRRYYSGKKKRHTIKIQVVINASTKDIIYIAFSEGKKHDFQLYKDSKLHFPIDIEAIADKGYSGLDKIHIKSHIPKKQSKNHQLTKEEKQYNRKLSKLRIPIEHVNCYLKRFKILSSRYRNKRRKFALRATLICGIYNLQH